MIEIPEHRGNISSDGRVQQYTISAGETKYFDIYRECGTIVLSTTNCKIAFNSKADLFTPPQKTINWDKYMVKRLWVQATSEDVTITILPHMFVFDGGSSGVNLSWEREQIVVNLTVNPDQCLELGYRTDLSKAINACIELHASNVNSTCSLHVRWQYDDTHYEQIQPCGSFF